MSQYLSAAGALMLRAASGLWVVGTSLYAALMIYMYLAFHGILTYPVGPDEVVLIYAGTVLAFMIPWTWHDYNCRYDTPSRNSPLPAAILGVRMAASGFFIAMAAWAAHPLVMLGLRGPSMRWTLSRHSTLPRWQHT